MPRKGHLCAETLCADQDTYLSYAQIRAPSTYAQDGISLRRNHMRRLRWERTFEDVRRNHMRRIRWERTYADLDGHLFFGRNVRRNHMRRPRNRKDGTMFRTGYLCAETICAESQDGISVRRNHMRRFRRLHVYRKGLLTMLETGDLCAETICAE